MSLVSRSSKSYTKVGSGRDLHVDEHTFRLRLREYVQKHRNGIAATGAFTTSFSLFFTGISADFKNLWFLTASQVEIAVWAGFTIALVLFVVSGIRWLCKLPLENDFIRHLRGEEVPGGLLVTWKRGLSRSFKDDEL